MIYLICHGNNEAIAVEQENVARIWAGLDRVIVILRDGTSRNFSSATLSDSSEHTTLVRSFNEIPKSGH